MKRKEKMIHIIDSAIIDKIRFLNFAKERKISYNEAVARIRRAHIILEHEGKKIIWVRCDI